MPFYPAQLAIKGGDIAAKIGAGPQVGKIQKNFLERIQCGQLENTIDALENALESQLKRSISAKKVIQIQ